MKSTESINTIIVTVENSKTVKTPVRIGLGDHRLRFQSAHNASLIDLEIVGPVALKPFLSYLYDLEPQPCEIVRPAALIRLAVTKQKTKALFALRYAVKVQTGKGRYIIQEKEKSFATDASRDFIIRYADRYIQKLRDVQSEKSAAQLIQWYDEWAHPITLEDVTAGLTEAQKLQAAKILSAYFAA